MKQFRTVLSMMLVISIIVSLLAFTSAENQGEQNWQADILKLMNEEELPSSTTIQIENTIPEGAAIVEKKYACELVSSNKDVLNVEFKFYLNGISFSDSEWSSVEEWLKNLVTNSVQTVQADPESLANVVVEAVTTQRLNAQPDAQGNMPIWANAGLLLHEVTATVPYYPELSNGVNGTATQRLQEKLIQLGYLNDKADGYYGNNTKVAVEQLETYVRELEQDLIDALPAPEPTEVPVATPAPSPYDIPLVVDEPIVEPEASVEPLHTPVTPIDGVAEALLQAYLFSDSFKITRGDLKANDSGDAVTRLQLRLAKLGYMVDVADGVYGGSTARSLRIFQYYNGLEQTGIADVATQNLLFADQARQPDNSMLTVGSSGDEVTKLQKQLRVLGFASISMDGDYGNSTKTGVENLQKYMREMESEKLVASYANQDVSSMLTVEVNGIADPMLLEDFYSNEFPAIPSAMNNGASGRDVVRLQRRLNCLEYYYSTIDGEYGGGTAKAITDFQKRNKLEQTGTADMSTLQALFNENALKALKPYVVKVSTSDQRVYVYGLDSNNEYTKLVRTMKCSTGKNATPTPTGTFQNSTGPGARWHYFKKFTCWAQYAYYIQGDIMFHSVLYNEKGGRVTQSSVNNLGRKASHGCVRLSVDDAKWLWNNCPKNSKIVVY